MNYSKEEQYWIVLASPTEITPKLFYYILKQYGCAEAFVDAVCTQSASLGALPPKAVDAASSAVSDAHIAEAISELRTKGIRAITRLCDEYPKLLAQIPYPPPVLFVRGSLDGLEDAISIVGTRRCTRRGAETARSIGKELSAHMSVVSGMALGIDAAAHKGAMDAGKPTFAVLGCGADVVYPPENADIYNYAIEHGAIISELPPGTEPLIQNFPARNRIVTGISRGTLIVESEMRGGTAISAAAAIGQGRDVFAVAGAPYSAMSELPNMLIKQGAVAVGKAADISGFYGFVDSLFTKKDEINGQKPQLQLDFLQKHIYNLLKQGDMGMEDIACRIDVQQSEINAAMTMMELFGLIRRLPGAKYGIKY